MRKIQNIILSIFSIATLVAQIAILFGIFMVFYVIWVDRSHRSLSYIKHLKENIYMVGFIATAGAIAGSLFLSEILKLQVCSLCWMQRSLIYPQAILFAFAYFKKIEKLWLLLFILNIATTIVAGYHYGIQVADSHSIICNFNPEITSSCNDSPFWGLGYITIPVMSFTYSIAMICLLWLRKTRI